MSSRTLLFLDCEWNRRMGLHLLVELSWVLAQESIDNQGLVSMIELEHGGGLIKPYYPWDSRLDADCLNCHKISLDMASTGSSLDLVLVGFISKIKLADYLVAHNLLGDWRVIGYAAKYCKFELPSCQGICTLKLAKSMNIPIGSRSLSCIYTSLFGEEITGAHRALVDVRAMIRIWEAWLARYSQTDLNSAHRKT